MTKHETSVKVFSSTVTRMAPILIFATLLVFGSSTSITVDLSNSSNLHSVPPIYWQWCGFKPASDMLHPNDTENTWFVGRVPRQGIHCVRIPEHTSSTKELQLNQTPFQRVIYTIYIYFQDDLFLSLDFVDDDVHVGAARL